MNGPTIHELDLTLEDTGRALEERGVVLSFEDECWLIEQEYRRLLGRTDLVMMN